MRIFQGTFENDHLPLLFQIAWLYQYLGILHNTLFKETPWAYEDDYILNVYHFIFYAHRF